MQLNDLVTKLRDKVILIEHTRADSGEELDGNFSAEAKQQKELCLLLCGISSRQN